MLSLKKYRYLLIKKTSASEQEIPQPQSAPLLIVLPQTLSLKFYHEGTQILNSSKYCTGLLLLWIICVIYVLCLSCFRDCLLLPCGHLLGKDLPSNEFNKFNNTGARIYQRSSNLPRNHIFGVTTSRFCHLLRMALYFSQTRRHAIHVS